MITPLSYLFGINHFQGSNIIFTIAVIFAILIFCSSLFYILAKLKPQNNYTELKKRTNSWWVMASVFMAATLIDTRISYISIAFLSFIAFREFYSLLTFRKSDRKMILWAYIAIPIQYYFAYIGWYGGFIVFIPVIMFLFLPLLFVLKGDTKDIIKSMAILQWVLMITVFGISHMAYLLSLPALENFQTGGKGLVLFLFFMTEINDVMQFTWGKLFGKHKILPKVSPNKTWEGFIGGVISTTIIGYFLRYLTPLDGLEALFVSFMIAIAGFFGDAVFSSVKRDLGIKDTGSLIPGHGGVLDRIDSLAYTAPTFFHLVYLLGY